MRSLCSMSVVLLVLASGAIADSAQLAAQETPLPNAVKPEQGMIKITLPPETELKTLIDFVSQRLGV